MKLKRAALAIMTFGTLWFLFSHGKELGEINAALQAGAIEICLLLVFVIVCYVFGTEIKGDES